MARGVFRSVAGNLAPVDLAARTIALKHTGKDMFVSVTRPRNLRHHNKMYKLFDLLWTATGMSEHFVSEDTMIGAIKIKIGHCDEVRMKSGVVFVPRSWAFHNMDQDEFDPIYAAVVRLVLTDILPNLNESDLEQELLEFAA